MTAFNIVRFKVKPGREQEFLDAHRKAERFFPGMRRFVMVKTGERAYCVMAEWASFDRIVAARPSMIGILDSFRDTLEDLGGGLGVTDPVAGTVVMERTPPAKAKKAARKPARTASKKAAKKKKARRRS
ncbi:MAG: antibiotic biosynthesis monooxygenase [Rhizomicrobium sp.]